MLRDVEHEKEILLGNKQLLGIFFLVVILLGVAFGSGYKVGQGSRKSSSVSTSTQDGSPAANGATAGNSADGAQTHTTGPESAANGDSAVAQTSTGHAAEAGPAANQSSTDTPILGERKKKEPVRAAEDSEAAGPAPVASHGIFVPQAGQTFLQVAAVSKDEADGIADVLRRKGFHAHAVPKPGSKLYRVIVGPVRDASDLSSTRNRLHNTGFREVIVQRY